MLIEKQIPHSATIKWETGDIEVRIDTCIIDDKTGEVKSRVPWRGVVDAGNTAKALELLGDKADKCLGLAGLNFGGWDKLEDRRAEKIEALGNAADLKR